MNRCKTCKHWTREIMEDGMWYPTDAYGWCACKKLEEGEMVPWPLDGLRCWNGSGCSMATGEDFGCVHWKGKDD